jgi:hypothetical protein
MIQVTLHDSTHPCSQHDVEFSRYRSVQQRRRNAIGRASTCQSPKGIGDLVVGQTHSLQPFAEMEKQ